MKQIKKKILKPKFLNCGLYLLLILVFAFITRLWNLWHPQTYIFDEVYHGFTAQEMAKGNKMAWEWWNTAPKGFAYEWTHPPLAKLIMALGVLLWGKSQFAFRLPGVFFGTGVIYLIYLLAKQIFKKEKIALLSAFFASFDGLLFVMSRVGMADIYFLFFLLLTILFCLKEKYLLSGISLGLAIATKWTGIYIYPVIGLILLCHSQPRSAGIWNPYRFLIKSGMTILIISLIIYLISYLPFFTSGHVWSQFIELQKQMWWYHTNLKAGHSYQSKAWTWPLMLRPVWFWVKYKKGKIGNIYNLGNPWLWWTGVLILFYAILNLFQNLYKDRFRLKSGITKKLGFILFCYFAFWLPWLFSPRIMFLHHYLPAVPFLCILIAYFLNEIIRQKAKKKFSIFNFQFSISQLFVICYLLFVIFSFSWFYPLYTGILIPQNLLKYWFWLPSWK